MDLRAFATNPDLEKNGYWEYFDIEESTGVKIARIGNEAYNQEFSRLPRRLRQMMDEGILPEAESLPIICGILSRTILKDWKGLKDNGVDLGSYDPEKGARMMVAYKDFRDLIWQASNMASNYRDEEVEEVAGNS